MLFASAAIVPAVVVDTVAIAAAVAFVSAVFLLLLFSNIVDARAYFVVAVPIDYMRLLLF